MTRVQRLDASRIALALAGDAEGFCSRFFPEGCKVGNYWQMADIDGGRGHSLTVRLRNHGGRRAGKWVDHATGEYGDLLDLLCQHLSPMPFSEVLRYASAYLGDPGLFAAPSAISDPEPVVGNGRSHSGSRLFKAGQSIQSTPAEVYLRNRCITRFGASLAFHPSAYLRGDDGGQLEFPALLAVIRDKTGRSTGCVRLFLDRDGCGLADIDAPKRVLGDLYQNGVRFGAWQKASDLIVGEGLENTLSVGTALPQAALTACITANHLGAFVWPGSARRIWIAHDNDDAGERAAERLRDRVQTSGQEAFLLPPIRDDFNTDLRSDGAAHLHQRLTALISARATVHNLWLDEKAA